jgi:hypothetical protein
LRLQVGHDDRVRKRVDPAHLLEIDGHPGAQCAVSYARLLRPGRHISAQRRKRVVRVHVYGKSGRHVGEGERRAGAVRRRQRRGRSPLYAHVARRRRRAGRQLHLPAKEEGDGDDGEEQHDAGRHPPRQRR